MNTLFPRKILWVDCETGGTEPKTDALTQLAAIIEVEGKIVDEINLKMKPLPGKILADEALNVQGRTREEVTMFDDPSECLNKFYSFLARVEPRSKTTRYVTAGYNVDFDLRFINQWFLDITGGPYKFWDFLQLSPIDVLPTLRAMRYAGLIKSENTKLETVCNELGIKLEAHDAMSDIRATRVLSHQIFHDLFVGYDLYQKAKSTFREME